MMQPDIVDNQPPNQPQAASDSPPPHNIFKRPSYLTGFIILGVAVIVIGLIFVSRLHNRIDNYQECANKYPKNKVVSSDQLICSIGGKQYTTTNPDSAKEAYQDQVLSFKYPSGWKVSKIKDFSDPVGYALSMESSLIDGQLSGHTKTKFKLTAAIFVRQKDGLIADCPGCEAKQNRKTLFHKPIGPYQAVFGVDNTRYGPPVVMNINGEAITAGTKDYRPYITLASGNKVYVKALIEFQDKGRMIPVGNVDVFINSPAYLKFESILNSLNIKV